MAYRNDRDADQARIAALESELGSANRQIESLERRKPEVQVVERVVEKVVERRVDRDAGGSQARRPPPNVRVTDSTQGRFVRRYEFDRRLPVGRCEDVLEAVSGIARLPGTITHRPAGPRWVGPGRELELTVADGSTTLIATDTSWPRWIRVCAIAAMLFAAAIPTGSILFCLGATFGVVVLSLLAGDDKHRNESIRMFDRVAQLVETELRANR